MLLHYHQNYPNIDSPAYHHNKQLNTMKTFTHNSFLKMLAKPFGMLFLMLLLAFNANAQTTFTGTGNWSSAANWDNGVPGTTDNAFIADGATCTLDIAAAVCQDLQVGDGSGTGGAILQINTNGIVLTTRKTTVFATCSIEVTGLFDFVLNITGDATTPPEFDLEESTCFVPSTPLLGGTSTVRIGNGVLGTTFNGTVKLATPPAGVVNFNNLNIDLGNLSFLHNADVGINISNNLILTSGVLGSGTNINSTLAIAGDLVVPAPGGTIKRELQFNQTFFDTSASDCSNAPIVNLATGNRGTTLEVTDVLIATGATLKMNATSGYLRVRKDWGNATNTGVLATGVGTPTVEFMSALAGEIDGANFQTANVVVNKAAGVQLKTVSTIISTGKFSVKSGNFYISSGSPQFNNICISGGDFTNEDATTAIVDGNWTMRELGTLYAGNPSSPFTAATIAFRGGTKATIEITTGINALGAPIGVALNKAFNQQFKNLTINKTAGTGIVENFSNGTTNATVVRVRHALTIESGIFFIKEASNFVNINNIVAGYTISHADGTFTDVPAADLDVNGANNSSITIESTGALNLTNVSYVTVPGVPNPAATSLTMWVGGSFIDKNATEPTPTTGFYVGSPSIALRQGDRPVVVFNGFSSCIIAGNYPLRNAQDAPTGVFGIILPNVIIGTQAGTNACPGAPIIVSISNLATTGAMRVLGDFVVGAGYKFDTASNSFFFGDQDTDFLDIFGRFLVSPGSTFYLATGNTADGAFMRVRQGGQITFDGRFNSRVIVTRDITAGQYYRMCAYSGSKVNASYTDFLFQGASNAGFFPTLPAAQTATQFNYGNVSVLNSGNNRNFLSDPTGLPAAPTAGTQSKGGFKILKGASVGNADVLSPCTSDDVFSPLTVGLSTVQRNFSSCSFQVGASCYTGLTINTGQSLNITEAVFSGSSGGGATCDFNIVNFFDDYFDSAFNTDGVNVDNIIYCNGCLGARAGVSGEEFDGGYFAGGTGPTAGRGDGEARVKFVSKQSIWWTGEANNSDWNDRANWSINRVTITPANNPETAPGIDNNRKLEVAGNALYIVEVNNKRTSNQLFQFDGVTLHTTPAYGVGSEVVGKFVKPRTVMVGGFPVVLFEIAYKFTRETNRDYEVMVPKGGRSTTVSINFDNLTPNSPEVWITGGLIIGGTSTTNEDNRSLAANIVPGGLDKTVTIGDKIVRVEDDVIAWNGNNTYSAITHTGTATTYGNSGVLEVGGNLSCYSFGTNPGGYVRGNDLSILRLFMNGAQQVRLGNGPRDISNLEINKVRYDPTTNTPLPGAGGGVTFQGGSIAMTVKRDAIITSGDLVMNSETPFIVERHFTMQNGGTLDLVTAYGVFGGNFISNGAVSFTPISGGRRIFFTPIRTDIGAATRIIKTNGQQLPPVSFLNSPIPWGSLATTFGIGGNFAYPIGAGTSQIVGTAVTYNLQDNLITSGSGGNTTGLEQGTIIESLRTVNTANNTTLRFIASAGATSGINILRIFSGGTLNLNQGVKLEIDATDNSFKRTLMVETGGLLQAIGASNTSSSITRFGAANPTGTYAFTVQGNIRARFYTFEFMDADGVNLATNAASRALDIDLDASGTPTIGDERCFSNCTFTNGTVGTAGLPSTYLKVHNLAFPNYGAGINVLPPAYPVNTVLIENVSFPASLGAFSSNVAWTNVVGKGTFTTGTATDNKLIFNLATGAFAGEDFDADVNNSIIALDNASNCIRFIEPTTIKWTGAGEGLGGVNTAGNEASRATRTLWNDPLNWIPQRVPLITDNVLLDRTHFASNLDYRVVLSTTNAQIRSLKIAQAGFNDSPNNNNKRIILQVGTSTTSPILQVGNPVTKDGGDFTIARNVSGLTPSTDINDAIAFIGNPAAQLNVGGNWSNDGRFINGSSTNFDGLVVAAKSSTFPANDIGGLLFVGTGAAGSTLRFNVDLRRVIANGAQSASDVVVPKANAFNNVLFIGPTTDLNSNMYIQGNLRIEQAGAPSFTNGLLTANNGGYIINIQGDWSNFGTFQPTSGKVIFSNKFTDQTVFRNFNYPFSVNGSTTVKQPEEFFELEIDKTPTTKLILDSRVFLTDASNNGILTLTSGVIKSFYNKELIIDIAANEGSGNNDSWVDGPVGRVYNSANADRELKFPIGDAGGWIDNIKLTARLTNNVRTTFSITQKQGPPATYATANYPTGRILPAPFNVIAQRAHWNLKNINFPIVADITGLAADTLDRPAGPGERADFLYGQINLPFKPAQQPLPASGSYPSGTFITTYPIGPVDLNGDVNTKEVSVIQTPATDFGASLTNTDPLLKIGRFSYKDKRGFAPAVPPVPVSASVPIVNATWIDLEGTLDLNPANASNNIQSRNFSHFGNGDIAIAYNFIPLPVELVSFSGKYVDDKVRLNWVVTAEKDVESYTVFRSANGKADSFVEIGTVLADVNAQTLNTYLLDDFNSFAGINYYRLSQKDKGGNNKNISKVIAVINNKYLGAGQMLLYPNPTSNAQFSINIPEKNEATNVTIYSLTGAKVFEQEVQSSANGKIENIDASKQLGVGLYLVRVKVAGNVYQTKLSVN